MNSAVVRSFVLLLAMAPAVRASAHGEPPAALAVLSHDEQGPRAVRLSAGVALRRAPQRYQFVCPAAWGDQFAAAVAALSDGTLVIGAKDGLKLLHEDGTVRAHPDLHAMGRSSEIVRSSHGLFSIRMTTDGSELLAVDGQQVRVLWRDPKVLYSLAAFDDKLVLLRGEQTMLEQLVLSAASGAQLERNEALLESPVDYVFARAAGGTPYALIMLRSSTQLGLVRMNAFSKLAVGKVSVLGPLVGESGVLIAIDGVLSQLDGAQTQPLAQGHQVLCLEQHDGLSYACDREGITRLDGQELGEPLFRLGWLTAPDLQQLSTPDGRSSCSEQWEDLRADLRSAGTTLLEEMMTEQPSPADAAALEASVVTLADAGDSDSGGLPPAGKSGDSCSALPVGGSPHTAFVQACSLFFLFLLRARAKRRDF